MSHPQDATRAAFRRLERNLARRRIQAVEPLLRIEVTALALLVAGFVFWQARIPLHAQVREAGPVAFAVAAFASALFLAALAAALSGARMAASLRAGPDGFAWLNLPLPAARIEQHLAWNAAGQALPLGVAGAGVLAAGVGLVPGWWLPLIGLAGAALIMAGARAGCWIAVRAIAPPGSGRAPVEQALARRLHGSAGPHHPAPAWRSGTAWRALLRKDLSWLRRSAPGRRALAVAVSLGALSVVAWRLPIDPHAARFGAFALALLAATALAEWLVAAVCADPFSILRSAPLTLADVWRARALWAATFALALAAAHALAGAGPVAGANPVFLIWLLLAALCIGLLGLHYGITLYPRADIARRLLGMSLGLAVMVSLMLPMAGWLVLLTALLHSTRRLPRWWRIEAV
jgi:hypothetical protein